MVNKLFVVLTTAVVTVGALAQDTTAAFTGGWTLAQCVARAKSENVQVRQSRLSVQQAHIAEQQARDGRLPTVNFSSSQGVGYRPFQPSNTMTVNGEQIVSASHKTSYSGSYGVNASMPLYDGGKTNGNIRLEQLNAQIAELTVAQREQLLEEEVTRTYVQVLYAQEAIKQDAEQVALAEQQLARAQELFRVGLLNKADVSQLESQLATDRYQQVADEMSRDDYLLQLKQLLELDGDYALAVADPQLLDDVLAPLPGKADVYAAALAQRPEIRAGQLAIDRSDANIELAKVSGRPTVNAQAASTTGNSTGSGNLFTQLKDQWSNTVGVSVSVPIYDHRTTQHAVARARLDREIAELDLTSQQKDLWKTIEGYWQQATSAQQRYLSAQEKVKAAQTSFELTSEQFRLGLKNIIELTTDKTQLTASLQQLLQAKYMAILNAALLRYYAGQGLTLQ